MQRLDDSELCKPPLEVLDIICKLGKGSYGSVYKARYKINGEIVAVKKVPVDSDLADIVKEISIMQQCDSPFIVKCYGSLFDSQDLWICMEYCGAGSIADIMRLCGKPLGEQEIATVLQYSLKGLDYLHQMRKIHRDIKAGNILLLNSGNAKLADFGVAGQLSDTLAKRNTVIGTPYWMAPEVIQEIGYNCSADIWSMGITAIEMADGKPPLADIHPMRALFMIPSESAPALRKPSNWSPEFRTFVTACLIKSPESRPTAAALLQTDFIRNAKPCHILLPMIIEANEAREKRLTQSHSVNINNPDGLRNKLSNPLDGNANNLKRSEIGKVGSNENVQTMVCLNSASSEQEGGLPDIGPEMDGAATLISIDSSEGSRDSFVRHERFYFTDETSNTFGSGNLDTMVVNDVDSDEDTGSVVVHDTGSSPDLVKENRNEQKAIELLEAALHTANEGTLTHGNNNDGTASKLEDSSSANNNSRNSGPVERSANVPAPAAQRQFAPLSRALQQSGFYPRNFANDPNSLSRLSYQQLEEALITLSKDLESELHNLAVRYRHKRQPLLDAIAEKTSQANRLNTNNPATILVTPNTNKTLINTTGT